MHLWLAGAAIGMMIWMWMSSSISLGAELNSEIEHQTVRDSTIGHAAKVGPPWRIPSVEAYFF
jgi:uncharacterized BrkB/YihY/UPF0761 family membrane protein